MKAIETQNKRHGVNCFVTKNSLEDGIVFSVGAAGARMPTTCVPAYRYGADFSGWLMTAHSVVEDGEINGTVCFGNRPSFTPPCK